jgi:hypothetical protein
MNVDGGGDPADRLVPNSVIMTAAAAAAAAADNLYIEDFNLEPLQQMTTSQHAQLVLPDMDALRLCRGGRASGGLGSPGGGISSSQHNSSNHHHHHHHQHQLHALMPANPTTHGGMLQLHNQTTATLQLADMQDPLRLGLTASYGHHHHHHQQQHTPSSMKYPGTPPDTPPGGMSTGSPSPPYPGQISLASPSATTINVDVSEIVWRSYQDQPIDLRGQCDLGGRGDPGDLAEAKWLSSLEYSTAGVGSPGDEVAMRQISVVTGLPASKTSGQTTVIEDEQVVSNFPEFLANEVKDTFLPYACTNTKWNLNPVSESMVSFACGGEEVAMTLE